MEEEQSVSKKSCIIQDGDKMAKILIIDDEVHIIELAKLYLQRDGFQVEYATKGQDGLAMWLPSIQTLSYWI